MKDPQKESTSVRFEGTENRGQKMNCEYCNQPTEMEAHSALGVICEDCYYAEARRRANFDRIQDGLIA